MTRPVVLVVLVGFAVVGLPFVLFGVVLVRRGRRQLAARAAVRRLPTGTAADVQAGQRVKLVGRVTPAAPPAVDGDDADRSGHSDDGFGGDGDADGGGYAERMSKTGATTTPPGTFPAGFTGAPAVAAHYTVTEYRPGGDDSHDTHLIHDARRAVRFRLADDTGSVAVAPDEAAVDPGDDHRDSVTVAGGATPPPAIEAYVARTDDLDPARTGVDVGPVSVGGRRRTYVERTIRPDDDVVVVGTVDRDPDAPWGDSLRVTPRGDDGGVVTARSLEEQDAHSVGMAVGSILVGAVLTLGPLAVLGYILWELGVV
jgi:hypothetical protein